MIEEKTLLFLGDGVDGEENSTSPRALTALRFALLAEKTPDLLSFLSLREKLKKGNVVILNDDPSFESTLYRAYEAPLSDEERFCQLRTDLHALHKRLSLPILEEEIRAYALLELRAYASREKSWDPLYEKVIAEAKGGSFLGVTHKTILDTFFADEWANDPASSFSALVGRFLADESYDLSRKKTLSANDAIRALGQEPILSPLAAKDLLRRLYGLRATGDLYLAYDGLFYAAALARANRSDFDANDLASLHELYYLASHPTAGLHYDPSSSRWSTFLHLEEMI
jgi:hypothetical protein